MIEPKVQMSDFQLNTYESLHSYPELTLTAKFIFDTFDMQISNIDMQTLKEELLTLIKLRTVKINKPTDIQHT